MFHELLFFLISEVQSPWNCTIENLDFSQYYMFFDLPILICLFPLLISPTFSCLAYRNVRHLVRPQLEITRRRLNRQLTAMIFSRVITLILAATPFILYRVFSSNSRHINRNDQSSKQWITTPLVTLLNIISYI